MTTNNILDYDFSPCENCATYLIWRNEMILYEREENNATVAAPPSCPCDYCSLNDIGY